MAWLQPLLLYQPREAEVTLQHSEFKTSRVSDTREGFGAGRGIAGRSLDRSTDLDLALNPAR